MSYPGKLIVVKGPDGAGKTDLCGALAESLRDSGHQVLELREPGGCPLSEHIRGILKGETAPGALTDSRAEALLFAASRAELVATVIRPALERGIYVLCDRFIHSSLVYQGIARGLPVEEVRQLSTFATDGLKADRVLCLTVSKDVASQRMKKRDGEVGDRIEEGTNKDTIREWYGRLGELDSHQLVTIDADGSRQGTLTSSLAALADLL